MIEKRHVYMSDDLLRRNPCITAYKAPSLDLRQELANATVPELGSAAARAAIQDWGRQASDVTHLVFCTTVSGCMPGADFELVKLLGLPLSTKRFMLYQAGCHGGGIALRLAKDLAENNPGARVLVVCSEVITMAMRGPSETHMGNLVGQAIFGDAAGAAIVGAVAGDDLMAGEERPLFEMVSASQDIIPGTEEAVVSKLYEEGIVYTLHRDVALHISSNIERLVKAALDRVGVAKDWNDEVFWVVHPGGRDILDRVQTKLGLRTEKLEASREVMRQHGNTLSSCVILVMEAMRRRSAERAWRTPGEGLEWGLLFGFGPGLTVETIVLRALPYDCQAAV
ncbi:hypothetical protein BDA96_05G105800 [Sorghum bicolor]|jgi:predicted naringenin-chalcone synthase|nr:chalcone synthase isoform X2 [Sorghum bicolor]KAG0529524.1 hypothetical protein BDA96_05G105800 [Sorghum bicolor]KXG28243.1 hypothetical protein SORBI_3005G102100 [Sorghum bicolor]|eukprot:XP_021316843.1 chalcone synthase isoform X2 [Sorghum bicolor]